MEVGRNWDRLHYWTANNSEEERYDLVIVDILTKSAHFLEVNQKDYGEKLEDLYVK
jgi:hypothetical protein